jgi:hypothetical protein
MTHPMPRSPDVRVPAVRQDVVDRLTTLLAHDDTIGFAQADMRLAATRAEVAAAAAGLVESRQLELGALQHALEILGDVARLPEPGGARAA